DDRPWSAIPAGAPARGACVHDRGQPLRHPRLQGAVRRVVAVDLPGTRRLLLPQLLGRGRRKETGTDDPLHEEPVHDGRDAVHHGQRAGGVEPGCEVSEVLTAKFRGLRSMERRRAGVGVRAREGGRRGEFYPKGASLSAPALLLSTPLAVPPTGPAAT